VLKANCFLIFGSFLIVFDNNSFLFEGEINGEGLNACPEFNIGCVNNNIELYNLNPKKTLLGTIEAREFVEGSDTYIAPALVYNDGTYEGLHEIFHEFADLFDDWKK
jgi:hypothetical protein